VQLNSVLADDINDTWSAYPRDTCIDRIFHERAAERPGAIAIVHGGEEVTYRELDEASDRLANYIADRGCGRESIVGLCIDRSAQMIVAILAVLKAGGAFLPLDTDYPADRLRYMVDTAGCRLILGTARQLAPFEGSRAVLLDLDEHRDATRAAPAGAPRLERTSSDIAYVMYTSGTTGEPKGVAVKHHNISRLVINTNYVDISEDDVFLQLASVAFDASTFEIWGALLNGAKLVLYDRPHMDVRRIESIIKENGVSILWLSAGLFNQVTDTSASIFEPVKQLLVGGDVLSVSHVRKVMDTNPGCQLINGYGPTECTTFSVCFRITPQSLNGTSIPIGRPVSNSQAHILDEALCPVRPGETGELFIGGDGVSRGYLGSPQLTAEKFVDVDCGGTTQRLYRTGDLVSLGDDGNIYFLGRADRQLKIRGYRVEPAEIEPAILACPGITQAVVVGNAANQGDKRLIAYVVGTSGEVPGSLELREMLAATLPGYMIPATFVYLDRIPLTPNGKVDRNALPKPEWKPLASSPSEAARTPMEQAVEAIWVSALPAARANHINESLAAGGGTHRDLEAIFESIRSRYGVALDDGAFGASATVASLVNHIREELDRIQIA
jgi:amino acid adenylation domain-containing protein